MSDTLSVGRVAQDGRKFTESGGARRGDRRVGGDGQVARPTLRRRPPYGVTGSTRAPGQHSLHTTLVDWFSSPHTPRLSNEVLASRASAGHPFTKLPGFVSYGRYLFSRRSCRSPADRMDGRLIPSHVMSSPRAVHRDDCPPTTS